MLVNTDQNSSPQNSSLFQELHLFKKNVEEGGSGLHHFPYTVNKNKVLIYKTIFFLLSSLFAIASFYIYKSYLNLNCLVLFGMCEGAKALVSTFCIVLSAGSLIIALKTHPSKEIVNLEIAKIVKQAKTSYSRKKRNNYLNYCGSNESLKKLRKLKQIYEDFLESINDLKEETLQTMQRITLSKFLNNNDKEKLLNQAVLELQFKLRLLIKEYKSN